MLRKLGTLNFIDHFKYGALTITIPLYLVYRGIDVGEIGLILSLFPLAFVVVRVLSSVYADVWGVKPFFIGSSVFQVITSLIYLFANNPLTFGIGKICDGVNFAFFWAVDRTAIMARAHRKKDLLMMSVVRSFAAAIGLLAAGFFIAFVSFEVVFSLLIGMGLVALYVSSMVVNRGATVSKPNWKDAFKIRKRQKHFWEVAACIVLLVVPFNALFTFLLPVMMDVQFGMGYLDVAIMLTAFYCAVGFGSFAATKLKLDESKLIFFQVAAIATIMMLPFAGTFFSAIVVLTGFGFGVCFGISEAMLGYISESGRNVSSRIALLIVPTNIATFLMLAGSGYAVEALGDEPIFVLCAVMLAGFVYLSKNLIEDFDGTKATREKELMKYHPHRGPANVRH